ncbi:MAG: hypothetical protein FWE90_00320 [Defluviitaleaceae bacterium]|nr:hypothetical protein [Defluviitaleaceae bacterium]
MDRIQWLAENGGPALKLRMIKEALVNKYDFDADKLADALLRDDRIRKTLGYFYAFYNFDVMRNNPYDLIHNCYENCLEMFMPFLTRLGFHAGVTVFNQRVLYLRNIYPRLFEISAGSNAMPFHGIIVTKLMLKAGYFDAEMETHIRKQLDAVHKTATLGRYDFYETDKAFIRQPKRWKGFLILKDMYNPYTGTLPLPIIYVIELLLYIREYIGDETTRDKIDDVMRFILSPEYQKTRGDYGWHWDADKKTYHATTGGFGLPLYKGGLVGKEAWGFLSLLETASLSPVVRASEWFAKCLSHLGQYETYRGTYLFPDNLLSHLTHQSPGGMETLYRAFLSEDAFTAVKRSDRRLLLHELYSTLYMAVLLNRRKIGSSQQ